MSILYLFLNQPTDLTNCKTEDREIKEEYYLFLQIITISSQNGLTSGRGFVKVALFST